MSNIEHLSPTSVWKHFYQLTQCPRPSKKEEKVIQYLQEFCQSQKLDFKQDGIGNVIISKPATSKQHDSTAVILQGHLDMVCQKNNHTEHDFENDPIKTKVVDEWVVAEGTTLGADNGIGVAAALAVLESDIEHGPLEVLLTIDEESGMTGAKNLDQSILKGELLLNLDSEGEGKIFVGCAGGINISAQLPYTQQALPTQSHHTGKQLNVHGLCGGHSGLDIDKGRGNANKILNRLLRDLIIEHKFSIYVSNLNGGNLRNAIPREASVELAVQKDQWHRIQQLTSEISREIKNELMDIEQNLEIEFTPIDTPSEIIDPKIIESLIFAVDSCPNGVIRMSQAVAGIPETSNNLASITTQENTIDIQCMTRSFLDSARNDAAASVTSVFKAAGAETDRNGAYPGWQPDMNSKALFHVQNSYEALFGKKPDINVIHAGLECGILGKAYPNWDMVSFGPTIVHAHSPDEKVHIESVQRFWDLLVYTLKNI